jgi:hypothetical protein
MDMAHAPSGVEAGVDWEPVVTSTCVASGGEVAVVDGLAPPEDATEKRSPARPQGRSHVSQARPSRDRRGQFFAGEGAPVQYLPRGDSQLLDLLRPNAEPLLPSRALPRAPRSQQRQEVARLRRREEVERAAHSPGLDQVPIGEGARDLTRLRVSATKPHSQLRRRR